MNKLIYPFLLCAFLAELCAQTTIDTVVITTDGPFEANWGINRPSGCSAWEVHRDSIKAVQFDYFIKNIFNPLINNTRVSVENRKFLEQLKLYLENGRWSLFKDSVPFITPVYRTFDLMDKNYFAAMNVDSSCSVNCYVSGLNSTKKVKVKGPTLYGWINTCAEMSCKLEKHKVSQKFYPLIATSVKIKLNFTSSHEINILLQRENKLESQCTQYNTSSLELSFATLENIPGLYFTYSSNYQSTRRSIVMRMGNDIAILWTFGCYSK